MISTSKKSFLPLLVIFLMVASICILAKPYLATKGFDYNFFLAANAYLFIIHLVTFLYQQKTISHKNPNAFVRAVLGGMMFKMFTTVIVLAAYIVFSDGKYESKSLFAAMILYLVYLAAEVIPVSAMVKKSKNV